jgi:3'-phosphoadenosine 5'-phosphosulfate sulfotransferase (PAPS reductase)/FAD synthetase
MLRYRDRLIAALGLTDVRTLHPRSEHLAASDADGMLWLNDPDRCCALRKVVPQARALNRFDTWLAGRKRCQGSEFSAGDAADGRSQLFYDSRAYRPDPWGPTVLSDLIRMRQCC